MYGYGYLFFAFIINVIIVHVWHGVGQRNEVDFGPPRELPLSVINKCGVSNEFLRVDLSPSPPFVRAFFAAAKTPISKQVA